MATKKFADRVSGGPNKANRPVEKLPTSPGPLHKPAKQTLGETPRTNPAPKAHVKTSHTTHKLTSTDSPFTSAGNPNMQPTLPSNGGKGRSAM